MRPSLLPAVTALVMGIAGALPCAFGQHLSFGVIGGASLTNDFQSAFESRIHGRSGRGGASRQPENRSSAALHALGGGWRAIWYPTPHNPESS